MRRANNSRLDWRQSYRSAQARGKRQVQEPNGGGPDRPSVRVTRAGPSVEVSSKHAPYPARVQSIGIVAAREPEAFRGDGSPSVRLTFRGLLDSRTAADRDTRVRVTIPVAQAARLWR